MSQLRITEIFFSLQGESRTVGIPTIFIRLTGCPLRCGYCDTAYAFNGGEMMSIESILETCQQWRATHVTVTGGEPMAQPDVVHLLTALNDRGYEVSLETSGAMDLSPVDKRTVMVMDLKTPGSGEVEKNLYSNCELLGKKDQVKFVICDRRDYDWANLKVDELGLVDRVGELLFSPSHEVLAPKQLAEWILQDQRPYRMQIQLHKYIWGDLPGV